MKTKTKVLIVEHDPTDIELMEYQLTKGGINYIAEVVENEKDYLNALKIFNPDIILCDYSLPSFDGSTAFEMRGQMAPETPFIFVSGTIGELNSIEFVENGVTDYALKDKLFTLSTKVKRALRDSGERVLRNQTNIKLAASEGKLARAQQIAHIGNWELDLITNVLALSAEGCRILGFHINECQLSFETWISLIHPADVDLVLQCVTEAKAFSKDMAYQYRIVVNGAIRHIYAESKFELDLKGEVISVFGIMQDITERKEGEEKIKKANRLYAFISQVNQTIVHVEDQEALFRKACRIAILCGKFKMAWIGLFESTDELIQLAEQGGIPDEDINLFSGAPLKGNTPQEYVLRTGNYYICNQIDTDLELNNWKPFAAKHNICSLMVLPLLKSGKLIGTFNLYAQEKDFFDTTEIALLKEVTGDISFALDIFEKVKQHKQTEKLVIQNERRFRALIEKSSDMKTLTNFKGEFIYCSPSVTKTLGYEQEELLNKSIFHLIHPDDAMDEMMDVIQRPGTSLFFQLRMQHKLGHWTWCEGSITNMLQEPGLNALVSNFRDISERKTGEGEREKMILDITQRNGTLEQFTYIVSHNLRAPIAKILGLASIMESESSENAFIIKKIVEETTSLDNVVRDINTIVSSRRSDKEKMELVNFETNLDQIKQVLEVEIKNSCAAIASDFVTIGEVFTFKSYLYSILYNLVSNSIKYRMPDVPLQIHIKSTQDKKFICLSVKDNGRGIDLAKNGPKIFGLYKRFHGNEISGRGIGLNLVKTHAESMGGRVEVESEVNKGTTFKIYIPKIK